MFQSLFFFLIKQILLIKLNQDSVPCYRCAGDLHEGAGPVHPAHVDHVPGERGAPAGHGQLLHQLPHLLLCLQAVQVCPLQRAGGLLPKPQPGGDRASAGQVRAMTR